MHTARVSLLFVCRSKKVESFMFRVSAWLMMMEEGVLIVVNPFANQSHPTSKSNQSKSKGKAKQSNWARRPRQYADSKKKATKL
jgi:hypothetical protein